MTGKTASKTSAKPRKTTSKSKTAKSAPKTASRAAKSTNSKTVSAPAAAASAAKPTVKPGPVSSVPAPKPSTSHVPAPPAAKLASAVKPPVAAVVKPTEAKATPVEPGDAGPMLKKQELFKKAADRSGLKKNQIKPAIEAALEVIGEALAQGREVNLPPLGKIKQNRVKETAAARIIIAKIRQSKPNEKDGKETVADAAE